MRSKPILLTMFFSAVVLIFSMVNVNLYKVLPLKATFHSLTKDVQKQVTCLADNIYFEAAHEPLDGKKAVAFVTINRVQTGNYASNICDVVYQKTGGTCQFSWYCDGSVLNKRLTIRDTKLYNEIRELATHMVVNYERMKDVTHGATYYHADYVRPGWKLDKVDQIGRHIFYKRKGDEIDRNKEFY
jgi:spore germination cell wall hydrolase CwlJ-like protein